MSDREILAEHIKALEASVDFYSPNNKREREAWVAERFIQNIGIDYCLSEIDILESDPPDFIFRNSKFEIKEMLDQGRKRHDEYREELKRAKNLTRACDLYTYFSPKDKTLSEIADICFADAEKVSKKYNYTVRAEMNLLFYVNLKHVYIVENRNLENQDRFSHFGWKSVSFVTGSMCCVLYAGKSAPDFIALLAGKLSIRNS